MKLLVLLLLPCLSLSELVPGPGFGKCDQFFLRDVPPQFTPQWGNSVQHICQCVRDNNDPPNYFYATLYNTAWKIPIYSAYAFKESVSVERKDRWYIEPQLDGGANDEACMAAERSRILNNQAENCDYDKSGYDRGHLYPVMHTDNHLSMLATSTLTNAAPQDSRFNQHAWRDHEKAVIDDVKDCHKDVKAYVVTGVVPDHNITPLKNRVTVSRYYWRATCCLKKDGITGKGYFGPNGTDMTVKELSITALQTKLATDYGVNTVVIFPGAQVAGSCK